MDIINSSNDIPTIISLLKKYYGDENICAKAAKHGDLDVIKWARANNVEWDFTTTGNAAYYGHLEVLKWAISNGCIC